MDKRHLLGALETGGTKTVCATGYEDGTIVCREEIPTSTPEETIPAISQWFVNKGASAVGIASFGPTAVDPASPDYGKILNTPKTAWVGYDLLGNLKTTLGVPCGYDTDVNAACLGEATFGCAKGIDDVLYLTIGTGVGAGVLIEGELLHGMLHPEAGHIPVIPDPRDPLAGKGACAFHRNCLEGYIAAPAIAKRWEGRTVADLAGDEEAMDILSGYLAQALATYALCYSPKKIIVGGTVADGTPIVELARAKTEELMGGYIVTPETADFDSYIVSGSLDGDQGVKGCLELARRALTNHDRHIGTVNL